jgi:hypothetical protein
VSIITDDTILIIQIMRLVQFNQHGQQCLGLELSENGDLINLNKADESIPRDMRTFLECGEDTWNKARRLII